MPIHHLRPDRGRPPGWKILTIADIPFYVEPSFLLFIGIILIMGLQNRQSFSQAGLLGFVIFFSLLAHEAGHALMARLFGYQGISVSLVMFGGNTRHPPATRGHSLLITLAGPLMTLGLVAASWFLLRGDSELLTRPAGLFLLSNFLILNLFWAIFNLLPIYPLDGGQALFHLLSFVFAEARALLSTAVVSILACLGILAFVFISRLTQGATFILFFLLMFLIQNVQIVKNSRG